MIFFYKIASTNIGMWNRVKVKKVKKYVQNAYKHNTDRHVLCKYTFVTFHVITQ